MSLVGVVGPADSCCLLPQKFILAAQGHKYGYYDNHITRYQMLIFPAASSLTGITPAPSSCLQVLQLV